MKTYHLFISHSWTYTDEYKNLINLLEQAKKFNYYDYSIPKNDPVHAGTDKKLSKAIQNQMQLCSIVIVLAGVYASYSKWIDKEIKIAKNGFLNPKPILAIEPWGSERTSLVVKNNADRTVKWNTESVVSAIRELT